MSREQSFGLQWRLAVIYLAVGLASSIFAVIVYLVADYYGLTQLVKIILSLVAGFITGIAGAVAGTVIARSVKLRLWEAGRLAGRIARGDYGARIEEGTDDEVGWLEVQLNQMAGQLESAIDSLKDLAEQNKRLGEEAGRGAALEERMRLARDLHDTVNQQLFVLAMRLAALKRRMQKQPEDIIDLLEEMDSLEELSRDAHSQIRALILELRPVTLEKEGLAAALSEYLKSAAEREGWSINLDIDSTVRVEGVIAESLFRIVQEALNNISKHAAASNISVFLKQKTEEIMLIISDDGIGFEPGKAIRPTAMGLAGIRERVATAGGKVVIESSPGRGTSINVKVPLRGKEEGDLNDTGPAR